jgi:uncharacterized protein (TIGR03000 family)
MLMNWQITCLSRMMALAASVLLVQAGAAPGAPHGGRAVGPVYHGGYARPYGHYGYYGRGWGPGYGPYHGFYRPYYGYGYGFGFGIGVGFYAPYYGYGYGYPYPYPAYPTAVVVSGSAPTAAGPVVGEPPPADQATPPKDDAAHLQLIVPENAQVLFNGGATTKTGRVREFITKKLIPGKSYTYVVEVRYSDTTGKPVVDRREIHIQANDWFGIDFTRPAPPDPAGPPLPPPTPLK